MDSNEIESSSLVYEAVGKPPHFPSMLRYNPHLRALFGSRVIALFSGLATFERFGAVALTESEREGLWKVFANRPDLLLTIVKELVKVTGVR